MYQNGTCFRAALTLATRITMINDSVYCRSTKAKGAFNEINSLATKSESNVRLHIRIALSQNTLTEIIYVNRCNIEMLQTGEKVKQQKRVNAPTTSCCNTTKVLRASVRFMKTTRNTYVHNDPYFSGSSFL